MTHLLTVISNNLLLESGKVQGIFQLLPHSLCIPHIADDTRDLFSGGGPSDLSQYVTNVQSGKVECIYKEM